MGIDAVEQLEFQSCRGVWSEFVSRGVRPVVWALRMRTSVREAGLIGARRIAALVAMKRPSLLIAIR